MKTKIVGILIGAVALVVLGVTIALAQPKGDTMSIKGEVIDLWCYLEGGDHGAEHKDCAVSCAKAGNPIGILTEKGQIYIAMGMKDHQPGREVLISKMADTVTVEGTVVKKGGVQVIYITSVK
jgi:hypothetical protein